MLLQKSVWDGGKDNDHKLMRKMNREVPGKTKKEQTAGRKVN